MHIWLQYIRASVLPTYSVSAHANKPGTFTKLLIWISLDELVFFFRGVPRPVGYLVRILCSECISALGPEILNYFIRATLNLQ